ncbi:MAG: hypothetical protein FJ387_29315 [Verrucomicrobia bacterium]|nr:hypothetical protein [Verrucomicrobiota bacterium]
MEEDLRQRVFTLLTDLANGFASRAENAIPDTPDGLRLLYENCLIYLYRLLFILYAEGRLLLPVEPRTRRYYKELSLERLKPDLKNFSAYDSHTRTRLGQDVRELFQLVNGTEKAKNDEYTVPRYNGGLFDPSAHPALEHWSIGDADLANVLRGLMFDPLPRLHEPALPVHAVDFGDLRVQQLGSIYEGLLEHHFVRNAAGQLELRTDKAERKATGTYYTPDYIVKYIVEQTLGPLLAEIEQRPEVKAGRENSFADAVLALNLCDPAMGSGHFLVEATMHLAEQIVFHPTTRRLSEKSKDAEEIAYWRRRVVEACIYGVDLNPLAVELAKLSLWLTCIAGDQPLSFLDHHLRCGNALIGAQLDQLGGLPQKKERAETKQMPFTFGPDFKRAVAETIQGIHQIEGEASRDVDAVKNKERRWQTEILPRLAPYKKVADLWTDTFIRFLAATAEMVFRGADVHPAIIVARKAQPQPSSSVDILVHETAEPFEQVLARRRFVSLPQHDLAAFDGNSWSIRLQANSARLVRTLTAHAKRLGELALIKRGLISGNRQEYFSPEKRGPKWHLIGTGTDVQRYGIEPPTEYVLFEKPGRTAGGCWDAEIHLKRGKILLKQVGRWPQAAVDEAPYCITGNIFAVILKADQLSPYYVAAVLNSRLTQAVWSVVLSDFKAVFPELKGEWIEQWPIRAIEFSTPNKRRTALGGKGKLLCRRDLKAESAEAVLAFVAAQLAAQPERADVVHDLLAFLAERMMELNRKKRATAHQFLTDLRDFHGIEARALTPKTRLDEFWTLDTPAFFAHLHQNAKVLRAAKVDLQEAAERKLRSSFEQARTAILAVQPQTAFTDRLIDQIVYRLYGLTEDEIQIVEGTAPVNN